MNILKISYCPKCRWLMRAAWMQQELLVTFEEEVHEFILSPSEVSGTFDVFANGKLVYSRKQEGAFPELKLLKQIIRDEIAPNKSLGHSDNKKE